MCGHNDLAPVTLQLSNRVQEFFLSATFGVEEINVIDEQDINVAKSLSKSRHRPLTLSLREVVHECFRREIQNLRVRKLSSDVAVDAFQQMRFPGPGCSVHKERVGLLPGTRSDLL